MRTASGVLLSTAAALGLAALVPARAAAPVVIEKSLLGVRILQTYHDVLAKWGQPTLVLRGGEHFVYTPAVNSEGVDLGGVQGVSYEGGSGGGGAPGGGGPGSGGPPMMGKGGGSGGMMPQKGRGGMGGGPGSGGGPGMGGQGGGSGSDADISFGESGGYAWIYYNPKGHVYTVFVFNLEGRVLVIMERGRTGGMPTQRGLKLGDPVKSLYDIYGWPDTIQDTDPGFTLDYGTKYHAKFAVIKNTIVGIGVVLEESTRLPFFPINGNGGGGAPGGGGMMGGGRMGGSGGRPGGGAGPSAK